MAEWLREELSEYCFIGVGGEVGLLGEQVPIAYKKELFQLLYYETFWLSDTPYIPGSRFKIQSSCPRICTTAILWENKPAYCLKTKKAFGVINLHLDHESAFARSEGNKTVLAKVSENERLKNIPIIIAGDFNAAPESDEMKQLKT